MERIINIANLKSREKVALNLIIEDYKFIYSMIKHFNSRNDLENYFISITPILGLIVNESINWIKNIKDIRDFIPKGTEENKIFYEELRLNIKFYEKDIYQINNILKNTYGLAEKYFSKKCSKFAKNIGLYDRYGVMFFSNYNRIIPVSNTINSAVLLPAFSFDNKYGIYIMKQSEYAGRLVSTFLNLDDLSEKAFFNIDDNTKFLDKDYGFFRKSIFSTKYNSKFILFYLLCNINFIIFGINRFIIEDIPLKLRMTYLLYFYICSINVKINNYFNTEFIVDCKYESLDVRNAMAHYGLWEALKDEIDVNDLFGGLTKKYFNLSWKHLQYDLETTLLVYRDQIYDYFRTKKIKII